MSKELQTRYSNEIKLPEKLAKEIEGVSKEKRLNKRQKEKLKAEVKKLYIKGQVEPGEVMGIIAAQSISEPATQMTMRTYHFAGSAGIKITHGLPRLIEIFDAKRSPHTPVMTVHLKPKFNNKDMARKIAEKIIERKISNVTRRVSIILNENQIEIEPLDLKRTKKMAALIEENIRKVNVKAKKKKIYVLTEKELELKNLVKIKEKIMKVHVDGIKNVSNAVVRREGDEWVINTIGTNLEEILKIKEVDETKTITNDIHETRKVLGIEAARNLIIDEALKTMQEQGLDVNVRHVMLVADIMCFPGVVKPIGRYGVAGAKSSILARAAFEETIKHLVRASVRGEVDRFEGIFENVMIGQVIPSGTGMFDLIAKFGKSEEK